MDRQGSRGVWADDDELTLGRYGRNEEDDELDWFNGGSSSDITEFGEDEADDRLYG